MTEEVKPTRDELIIKAKELYSKGSRNYLLKCYSESADELSEVCALYEEIYGELSDELGMPYLLYAKSLIALALDENKVIDVPDEEEDEDEDDDDDENDVDPEDNNVDKPETNKTTADKSEIIEKTELEEIKEPDSTVDKKSENKKEEIKADSTVETLDEKQSLKDASVTSTEDANKLNVSVSNGNGTQLPKIIEDDKPSTSNGIVEAEEDEENEAASSLQLAWEILELSAKIFTRQGLSGLPNLAEVQTELANIEFENNILDSAREDYEKALKIYNNLTDKYRRAMAEIHYKIGLTYLMQQMNQEGAESLKSACALIEDEINEMKAKENLTDKDTELIKDMEETKQEIWAKIAEIEETRQQNIAEVRAALDNFIGPAKEQNADESGPSICSSSSSAITSSSKPTDITHLIKRKKPDTPASSEAEAAASPAKRPAV